MINLNDLTYNELETAVVSVGEPKFRAEQLFKWFSLGVTDYDRMTNISNFTKQKLLTEYSVANVNIFKK